MIREELSALLKERREFNGIGYNEMARLLKFNKVTLGTAEKGNRNYRLDFTLKYLRICKSALVFTKNNHKYPILTIEDFLCIVRDIVNERNMSHGAINKELKWSKSALDFMLQGSVSPTVDKTLSIAEYGGYVVSVEDLTENEKQDVEKIKMADSKELVLPLFIFGSAEENGEAQRYVTCTDNELGFIATVTYYNTRPTKTNEGIIINHLPFYTKFQMVRRFNLNADIKKIMKLMRRCIEEHASFFEPKINNYGI